MREGLFSDIEANLEHFVLSDDRNVSRYIPQAALKDPVFELDGNKWKVKGTVPRTHARKHSRTHGLGR